MMASAKRYTRNEVNEKNLNVRELPVAQRPRPISGQSGPRREIDWEHLSADERAMVRVYADLGTSHVGEASERAGFGFKADPSKAKLRARNALRRLTQAGYVEGAGEKGVHKITAYGRRQAKKAVKS